MQEKVFAHPKITVIWDHVIDEILGVQTPFKSVTGLRLKHVQTGVTQELATDGLFVAIGHIPQTGLFKDKLPMDAEGYLLAQPNSTKTIIPGIFAAGDVQDKVFRQAVTAAGQGCMAALEAEKFLHLQ